MRGAWTWHWLTCLDAELVRCPCVGGADVQLCGNGLAAGWAPAHALKHRPGALLRVGGMDVRLRGHVGWVGMEGANVGGRLGGHRVPRWSWCGVRAWAART